MFYLATKYGGFTAPPGYQYSNTTPLPTSSWHTNADTFGGNPRPDNYFAGNRPDLVQSGLETAFKKIANAVGAYTTSFSSALPQGGGEQQRQLQQPVRRRDLDRRGQCQQSWVRFDCQHDGTGSEMAVQ